MVGLLVGILAVTSSCYEQRTEPEPHFTVAEPASAPFSDSGTAARDLWLNDAAEETGIPRRALVAYVQADLRAQELYGCTVGWNTLAGIGHVESRHGTYGGSEIDADGVARPAIIGIPLNGENGTAQIPDTDGGVLDGDTTWDRAVGPMQFIPQTWETFGMDANGDGVADVHNIDDAALSAARYLCYRRGSLDDEDTWIAAIRAYNNSVEYQHRVATAAQRYANAVEPEDSETEDIDDS